MSDGDKKEKAVELESVQQFKRRTGRFSEMVRKSAQTSTASFSSNRLTRRTVRQKKGLTELLLPQSKVRGAPLNDTDLQSNVIDNFCTYLERYALGIDGIFSKSTPETLGRSIAQNFNQDPKTIDFQTIVEPPDVVAGALVYYLESHKRPMVPAKQYDSFVAANSELKDSDRIDALRNAVAALPSTNRAICGRLLRLFYAIAENKDITGQDHAALGGIFGDTLLHNKKGDQASGADLVSFMIQNYYPIVFMAEYQAEREEKKEYDFDVNLTESDWKLLLTNAKLYKYKKDQVVFNEGEPNTQLFRIRKGTFKVTKRDKHVATLEPLSMFGEISFLGSYVADATVSAAEEDAELWFLDLKFVQQMFAMEPELSMKFYHFIGSYLAKRLIHLSTTPDAPYVSKTEHFARAVPTIQRVDTITPITEELVIKDYPCKLEKDGTLYIMQCIINRIFKTNDTNKIIPFDHITSLSMADNLTEILIVRKEKNKVSKIEFYNTQDCDEAFALIETMLTSRRRDPTAPMQDHVSRAVALYEFKGEHEHDLSFKVNDVIVVLQKRPDGWWLGERRGVVGYFPANFVRDDEGLPTLHDWEIVWLGGKTKDVKKGDVIINEDERSPGLYQILKGECDVLRDNKIVAHLNKEETFGEISYLGRGLSPHTVMASVKSSIREIPVSFLDKLFSNSPALASRVFKYLAVVLEMKLRVLLEPPRSAEETKGKKGKDKKGKDKKAKKQNDDDDEDVDKDAEKKDEPKKAAAAKDDDSDASADKAKAKAKPAANDDDDKSDEKPAAKKEESDSEEDEKPKKRKSTEGKKKRKSGAK